MRQLDSCDFCGTAPEAVFEVVPASVAGDARRLALCADCHATLQSVVDPLLAAAQADGSADNPDSGSTVSNAGEGASSGTTEAATSGDVTPSSTESTANPSDESASAPDDGTVTIGDAESGNRQRDDPSTEPSEAESVEQRDGGQQRDRKPDGYAKVVRLLQNREGAMPREELRTLATNAYDMGDSEFDDAVDAAVENGDLRETSDGLQTE